MIFYKKVVETQFEFQNGNRSWRMLQRLQRRYEGGFNRSALKADSANALF